MSRDEIMQMMRMKNQGKLLYTDFQKLILDFQLQEHEKFLKCFTDIFKAVDETKHGVVNELQFRVLIAKMGIIQNDDEVNYLLSQVDPYNNNKMTYSEVVQLLSSHMVPSDGIVGIDGVETNQSIPILEKFSIMMETQQPGHQNPTGGNQSSAAGDPRTISQHQAPQQMQALTPQESLPNESEQHEEMSDSYQQNDHS